MLGSVGEFGTRWFFSKGPQRGLMRYEPECYQNFEALHLGNFCAQEGEALPHFFRCWLVLGGNTADGVRDTSVQQSQGIICSRFVVATGKPKFKEGLIEKNSRIIPCEGPSTEICSFEPGGKSHNQQFSTQRPERGNGRIMLVWKYLLISGAKGAKARTKRAIMLRLMGRLTGCHVLFPRIKIYVNVCW